MGLIDDSECFKLEKIDPQHGKCESCIMSKMHRTPNHKTVRTDPTKRATRKGQRFHTDLAGGGHIVRTPRDKRYAIVFVDDYTDYTWLYLIKKKSEFATVLKDFIHMIKAKGLTIESFRMDNAKENINKATEALMTDHGIQWEPTVPDNSHQNGVPERAFRTIFNRVRSMLYDSELPKTLWGEAAHTVVYLKNINPTSSSNMIPHEAWNDRKPDLSNLHPFGTLCFAKVEHTKKLDEQKTKGYLLDYETSNQYRIWEPIKGQIIRATHVMFDEYTKPEIGKEVENYSTLDFRPLIGQTGQDSLGNQCTVANTADSNDLDSGPAEPNAEKHNSDNSDDHQDSTEPTPPTELIIPTEPQGPRRSIRTQAQPERNFAHQQNPWNRNHGDEGVADPGTHRGSVRIAKQIKQSRTIDLKYKISQNWQEIQSHSDKKRWIQAAKEEFEHHKHNGT